MVEFTLLELIFGASGEKWCLERARTPKIHLLRSCEYKEKRRMTHSSTLVTSN